MRKMEPSLETRALFEMSPIGSGQGILNPANISLCLEYLKEDDPDYPVIVDAGVGTASDVTVAMEIGADGVLLNTGIAGARELLDDPVNPTQPPSLQPARGSQKRFIRFVPLLDLTTMGRLRIKGSSRLKRIPHTSTHASISQALKENGGVTKMAAVYGLRLFETP